MKTLKRRYPSNYSSVSKARREVASFARSCGLFASDINDIALAVGEACNNAAEHGHVADGEFTVRCSYESGKFIVEVGDAGCGFDPAGKGKCLDPEYLGIRGLGIFIMRSLMDDICYTAADRGTCVRLTKYAPSATLTQAASRAGQSLANGDAAASRDLGVVHHELKALLKSARLHPGGRRQR